MPRIVQDPDNRRQFLGPGGYCVCPNCGTSVSHITGQPCYSQRCPVCNSPMVRQTGQVLA